MPKLKTNRAASKRFRKTANGFKSYSSGRRHNLGHKDSKRKRLGKDDEESADCERPGKELVAEIISSLRKQIDDA